MPGFQELLVIAVVALLVVGPQRLPELARNAGKLLVRFQSETQRNVDELRGVAEVQELEQELKSLRNELRSTKADVRRRVRASTGFDDVASAGGGAGTRDAAGVPRRADDDPPPVDLEAT